MTPSKDGKYWGNSFGVPTAPLISRDRWICVEFMLKHNTPGLPDGEQAFWIDGELQGHWKGINWRKNGQQNYISMFSFFSGRFCHFGIRRRTVSINAIGSIGFGIKSINPFRTAFAASGER